MSGAAAQQLAPCTLPPIPAAGTRVGIVFAKRQTVGTVADQPEHLGAGKVHVEFTLAGGKRTVQSLYWRSGFGGLTHRGAFPLDTPAPDMARVETCRHEDTELQCPFCGGSVDSDTNVCARCREAVAPVRVCTNCDEDVTAFWPYTKDYAAQHPQAFSGGSQS